MSIMDRRLQAHVLKNILDNGGWTWGWSREILYNPDALDRFKKSRFTCDDYYTCTVMLVKSSKVVERERHPHIDDTTHSPLCLTIDGAQYLKELRHPRWEWLKRNWFATVIATATVATAALNIAIQIAG